MLKEQNTIIPFSCSTARLKTDSLFKLLFVILCLHISIYQLHAQKQPDSLVSFQIQDMAFGEVLENLYERFGIKVAFNASDPGFNKKVSYSKDQVTVLDLLNDLLDSEGYGYRKIGDQYNVYKSQIIEKQEDPEPVTVTTSQLPKDTVFIQNAVIKTDTLIVLDTIRQTDTLVIRDTIRIFVDKPVESRRGRIKELRKNLFSPDANRINGKSVELYYGRNYFNTDFKAGSAETAQLANLWNESLEPSFKMQHLGVRLNKCSNNWMFSASLTYLDFAQNFIHNRTIKTGGYYEMDTLDSYYSISGIDTTWFHVVDSAYVPLEESKYSYQTTNRIGMLHLGVDAAHLVGQLPGVRFYARAGLGLATVIYKKGFAFEPQAEYAVMDMKKLELSPLNFTFRLAFLARMRISDELDLVPEVSWQMHFNDLLKDYPITTKPSYPGISLGLVYYF
ncbi:MAG: hypothetical protein PHG67_00815 [Bacteroidales bacterium]|jgi:hypothetical protein|nr:hypothetical protein [Bacteroidales bacterium]HOI31121.1 hypothetical protein [Bacteroidales bacterium]